MLTKNKRADRNFRNLFNKPLLGTKSKDADSIPVSIYITYFKRFFPQNFNIPNPAITKFNKFESLYLEFSHLYFSCVVIFICIGKRKRYPFISQRRGIFSMFQMKPCDNKDQRNVLSLIHERHGCNKATHSKSYIMSYINLPNQSSLLQVKISTCSSLVCPLCYAN